MSLAQPRILVADDQPDVVEALRLLLKANGFSVVPTSSPAGVLGAVETEDVDVVLMDLNYTRDTTSGREGLELLARLQQLDPQLPVVVMTAWGSVEGAVDAMRGGARDYVTKPWDNTRLVTTLRSHVELADALRKSRRLSAENERLQTRAPGMVAELEAAGSVGLGVGEGTLHVAEELALEDALAQRAGVHRHEGLAGPVAHRVDAARDDLLARPVLAGDEDVGVRGSDSVHQLQHRLHRTRLGDHSRGAGLEALVLGG